ncbi:MAG: lipoate--protein ligase family protein [Thermoplasmata archaeon]|nr:MAG: lipoate--protein ligase family protein [Thermoplasmata archaeon]
MEKFQMEGRFVPINDLVVNNKKISGNGRGEIGKCKVLLGNLLLDFAFQKMANILNVPNKDFRERVFIGMNKNLTTIKEELGYCPPLKELTKTLITEYERLLGPLTPWELEKDVLGLMKELEKNYQPKNGCFRRCLKRKAGMSKSGKGS